MNINSNIKFRPAKREDVSGILDIYKPEVLYGHATFEVEIPNPEEIWSRIQSIQSETPWLVATYNDKVIAYCYAGVFNGRFGYRYTRQVSIYVDPNYKGRGIGYLLYSRFFEILEKQGYKKLIALVVTPNPASVKLHTKLGFTICGGYKRIGFKFDKWFDIEFYELTLNTNEPKEIIPYGPFL